MAKREEIVGTGITKRTVTHYDGADGDAMLTPMREAWGKALAEGGGVFGARTLNVIEQARAILDRSGPGPHAVDSLADFAGRIVLQHEHVKAFIEQGDADAAARSAYEMGVLVGKASLKFPYEADALHGQKFGPKPTRQDALAKLIDDGLSALGAKASARAILDNLRGKVGSGVIQEIDDLDAIYWIAANGKERQTPFNKFQNRVSAARKKLQS